MITDWQQGNVEVESGYIHYYRTGQGNESSIVLIHGFSDNGLCWTPIAQLLERSYDVIMPDMRSHGQSARIHIEVPVDMASDLINLIRALQITHPVIIGHSMGAMIAYQVGTRYSNLAKAIILEDPPWWMPQQNMIMEAEKSMKEWARQLPAQTIGEIETANRKDHPDWSDEMVRLMSESKKQFDPTFVDNLFKKMNRNRSEWLTTIESINIPLLIITGYPELGGIVTAEVIRKIQEINPKVNIITIPDAGHLIHFDKQNKFMQIVRTFLNNLNRF
jgi:N-formylmaleamate deformylase